MSDTPTTTPEPQEAPKVRRKNPVTIDASAAAITYAEVLGMAHDEFVTWCVQDKCAQITANVRANLNIKAAP